MMNKDFHRTPKELDPENFQRYPMSSQHGFRSTAQGPVGIGSSRQHVLGDGIGFSHMQMTGGWVPHTQGTAYKSSYNRDYDLSILNDDMKTGHRADQQPGSLFARKQLFLRRGAV
jgi:hypothetical protein